jgi:RNA polymerase sigma-70 factor (subfamily 1)
MIHDDADTIDRAILGDQDALTDLLERHGHDVRARVAGGLPQRWQSLLSLDDVMQQAYTDAFLSIKSFRSRGEGSFTAWLTTLAKNNLLDAIKMLEAEKRGGGRRPVDIAAGSDHSFVALFEWLGGVSSTPSRHAAQLEARQALARSIEQLPEAYRQVVQMYDLNGEDIEAVAAALGRSAGAVYMLRARAHRMLAEMLGTASRFLSASA